MPNEVGLSEGQLEGIGMGLTNEQVLAPNFDTHTLYGISVVRFGDQSLSLNQAYDIVKGLDEWQIRAITKGLTREQVIEDSLDRNKYNNIDDLATAEGITWPNAYEILKGLDESQVEGVIFGLSREQVMVENFGEHTVSGMHHLIDFKNYPFEEAYEELRGMTEIEVDDFVLYAPIYVQQVVTHSFVSRVSMSCRGFFRRMTC